MAKLNVYAKDLQPGDFLLATGRTISCASIDPYSSSHVNVQIVGEDYGRKWNRRTKIGIERKVRCPANT